MKRRSEVQWQRSHRDRDPALEAKILPPCSSTIALEIVNPKPRPPKPGAAGLLKRVEYSRKSVRSDANPAINDFQPKPAALRIIRTQGDLTIGRRKFDGILNEIPKDLLQTGSVRSNAVFDCFKFKLYRQVFS